MSSPPDDLSISAARADALFASALPRSGEPGARQVRQAIAAAIGAYGQRGCAARVAQAYGEHPETAVRRMRWARAAAAAAFAGSGPLPAAHPGPARPPRLSPAGPREPRPSP
jgi:hypothetical protein